MAALDFTPNPGLTREQIESVLEYFGAFECDEYQEDGVLYDMNTEVSLSELPQATKETIFSHFLEQHNLDLTDEDVLEECDLVVRETKTVVIDVDNNHYSYQENGYYTYVLNGSGAGNSLYIDAPAGHRTTSFLNLEKGLKKVAWLEVA